jgi:arylsulfatase A-like enzyme
MAGWGESILLGIQRFARHEMIRQGSDFIWTPSLGDSVLFALVGFLAWVATRRLRPERQWRVLLGALLFLSFTAWLFMYSPLHKGAAMLLAAGIGVQLGALGLRFRRVLLTRLRPAVLVCCGYLVVTPLLIRAVRQLDERRQIAALSAGRAAASNVLLIILDTVRSFDLSLYGFPRPTTPALDRWAKRGVVFDRAYSTAPWTLPSHASIFTGHFPDDMAVDWKTPLGNRKRTLAEALREHGYLTGGFVANLYYCGRESGLSRGFVHYEDYSLSAAMVAWSMSLGRTILGVSAVHRLVGMRDILARKRAPDINTTLLSWLDRRDDGRPFFAFLNYFDAHSPYTPPAKYAAAFAPTEPRQNPQLETRLAWSEAEIERQHNAYDASLSYLDSQLDSLFRALDQRGLLNNTLIILASDHGEEFYEHGVMGHGNSLYLPGIAVPLVLWGRGWPQGTRVRYPVTLRNIPATVMDYLNLDNPFPGRSLARHWLAPLQAVASPDSVVSAVNFAPRLPKAYPVGGGSLRSVVSDRFHLILRSDLTEELFEIESDPWERHNVVRQARYQEILGILRNQLWSYLEHSDTLGSKHFLDRLPRKPDNTARH